ncbi:hypothetical protein PIB30_085303, partial [Stylosanthes scabra]|nr:hypothetical protein [Stylosanthes scabra]
MAMATQASLFTPPLFAPKPSDRPWKQAPAVSFTTQKAQLRFATIRASAAEEKVEAAAAPAAEKEEAPVGFTPPELDPNTPSPIFGGSTGGLLRKAQVEEFYVITWDSPKEQIFEMPTGGAAIMRQVVFILELEFRSLSVFRFHLFSVEELKSVICQNVETNVMKVVKSMLYRRPVLVFGGFIQFQTMSIVDYVSLQQMISIYLENMTHASVIELYVEFEQVPYVVGAVEEAQLDLAFDGYYSDSEEEFEGNYEMDDANEEDVLEHDMDSDVGDVTNALANEFPFQEASFMRVLDEEAMKAPEF